MSVDFFIRLAWFAVLCVAQVLILNHLHLFGVAIPLLYIYFPITFHRGIDKWEALLWSFVMGMAIDVASNTPGLAASALTLVGMLQPYLLELFVPRDAPEKMAVSVTTLGIGKFFMLSLILVLLFCLVFFALEAFNFFDWLSWLECVGGSTVLTLILILAIESVRRK